LSEDLETTVYRLVQEALTNVVKHAGATRVSVTVGEDGAHVLLSVADDGGGFDQNTAVGGFGLAGMRERVALAGGRLNIDSGGGAPRSRLAYRSAALPARRYRDAVTARSGRVVANSAPAPRGSTAPACCGCARVVSIVRGERCSLRAISTLVWPSAISLRTSTSRCVSLLSVSAR